MTRKLLVGSYKMARSAAPFAEWTTVAIHRSTKSGEKLENANGTELGGYGVDGRYFYKIEKRAVGEWRCSCPSNKYRRGPCKHLLSAFSRAPMMIRAQATATDLKIVRPEAF